MKQPKLPLTDLERKALRQYKIRINEIVEIDVDSLKNILGCSEQRAKELRALAEFQRIPSIGYKFARNLILLGYYKIEELEGRDPVTLFNDLETIHGVWIDPCVEDQFRLVVYYADHPNSEKQWWDFTEERKLYRLEHGHLKDRPKKAWFED